MSDGASPGGVRFLRGLARQLSLDEVVYVPDSGAPLTITEPVVSREPTEADYAVDQARRYLDTGGAPHPGPGFVPSAVLGVAARPVFVPVRSADGELLGVVAATKSPDLGWVDQERALFRYSVESHAADLDDRVGIDPSGTHRLSSDDELANALRQAVSNDELSLVFQPEYDLVLGRMVAVEALVRWQHPRFGELGPEWFISLAEQSDLISLVGEWVIDRSLDTLAGWRERVLARDLVVRINVSPLQLGDEAFPDRLAAALLRHGVPGDSVCLELTEDAAMDNLETVATALRRLSELGVASAMDDLATGYSTLSQLRFLPVDLIKIDRSLIGGIHADPRAQAIVTALVGLSLNFEIGIIAEGVEDEDDLRTLFELGCIRAQGHLLGMPMPAPAIEELLVSDHRVPTQSE